MFCKAVEISRVILKKIFACIESTIETVPIWEDALYHMTPDGVVILDQGIPWMEYLYGSDAEDIVKFVIFPHNVHGWVVRTVPTVEGGIIARYPLPYEWWGAMADNKKYDGLEFCYRNGFMAIFETKEQAIAATEYAVSRL
jgi:uncharacterized UPF0160 family protein